jgi:hypothetical protein
LAVGINRWSYRLLVYVALVTDQYPPFRLDQGSMSQLPAQRSDEHALTRSRVAGDDARAEAISAQLSGVTACDGVQHPLRFNVVRTPHAGEPPTPTTACTDWPDRT